MNQRGYKKITGEFLWITRNTGIAGMYAGSMMSKCAAKPSEVAWNAAVHAMHLRVWAHACGREAW
eukprot:COSAG01_NODE_300_length_19226_cov_41.536519_11_plen_65_part_00